MMRGVRRRTCAGPLTLISATHSYPVQQEISPPGVHCPDSMQSGIEIVVGVAATRVTADATRVRMMVVQTCFCSGNQHEALAIGDMQGLPECDAERMKLCRVSHWTDFIPQEIWCFICAILYFVLPQKIEALRVKFS